MRENERVLRRDEGDIVAFLADGVWWAGKGREGEEIIYRSGTVCRVILLGMTKKEEPNGHDAIGLGYDSNWRRGKCLISNNNE